MSQAPDIISGSDSLDFTGPDNASSGFNFSFPDISNLISSVTPNLSSSLMPSASVTPSSIGSAVSGFANDLTKAITGFYDAETAVNTAKANAAIAKARGQNAVATAQSGLPSPTLLLFGGLGLAALLIISKK